MKKLILSVLRSYRFGDVTREISSVRNLISDLESKEGKEGKEGKYIAAYHEFFTFPLLHLKSLKINRDKTRIRTLIKTSYHILLTIYNHTYKEKNPSLLTSSTLRPQQLRHILIQIRHRILPRPKTGILIVHPTPLHRASPLRTPRRHARIMPYGRHR